MESATVQRWWAGEVGRHRCSLSPAQTSPAQKELRGGVECQMNEGSKL